MVYVDVKHHVYILKNKTKQKQVSNHDLFVNCVVYETV